MGIKFHLKPSGSFSSFLSAWSTEAARCFEPQNGAIFNCSQTKFVAIILVLSVFFMRFFA